MNEEKKEKKLTVWQQWDKSIVDEMAKAIIGTSAQPMGCSNFFKTMLKNRYNAELKEVHRAATVYYLY